MRTSVHELTKKHEEGSGIKFYGKIDPRKYLFVSQIKYYSNKMSSSSKLIKIIIITYHMD